MPGRRLSQTERRLLDFWQAPPRAFTRPLLRQIEVSSENGLRGIRRLVLPLPYPITAICGRNGVGKSTILALAALSATPPREWRAYWGNIRPRRGRMRYTFNDFFHLRARDPSLDGLIVAWVTIDHGDETRIERRLYRGNWVTAEDLGRQRNRRGAAFPAREVDFIPVSRVLPAVESPAIREAFSRRTRERLEPLNSTSLGHLTYIMGKTYSEAETRFRRGFGLGHCKAGATYTGFDMGSGESAILLLLARLQAAPTGSLVVIEELELGLHAEAQVRLVKVMLEICFLHRLQVICTTHSETVLDTLPRRARVLVRKNGEEHEAITNVSTRFAVHEMSGSTQPELVIYTEDQFAAGIVGEALSGPQRARLDIRDVGSNATVARQAIAHLRLHDRLPALSVFDGDTTVEEVEDWLRGERADRDLVPNWLILPADRLTPERWILRELGQGPYFARFCEQLNCNAARGQGYLEAMRAQLNHHDSSFELSRRTGLQTDDTRAIIIRSVARDHPALQPLRDRVAGDVAPAD